MKQIKVNSKRMTIAGGTRTGYLDPARVELSKDAFGNLVADIEGKGVVPNIRPVQSFPLSHAGEMISLLDHEGREAGILPSLRGMDAKSIAVLENEFERAYFMPCITRVYRIVDQVPSLKWVVETDRGERTFKIKNRREAVAIGGGRVLVTDVQGNRYDIPNRHALDARSRHYLDEAV